MEWKLAPFGKLGKPKSVQEMEERIEMYLSKCYDYGLPPTIEGMTMAIDYNRRAVYDLENQRYNIQFSDTVQKYKDYIANYDATLALTRQGFRTCLYL